MEQRRESRLKANQAVVVSSLGLMQMPPVAGRTLDVSGSGLRLRLPSPIPCGSPVKVEADQMVMMGEVSRCEYDSDSYIVSLMVLNTACSPRRGE
jgi:hypothetical protein